MSSYFCQNGEGPCIVGSCRFWIKIDSVGMIKFRSIWSVCLLALPCADVVLHFPGLRTSRWSRFSGNGIVQKIVWDAGCYWMMLVLTFRFSKEYRMRIVFHGVDSAPVSLIL